MSSTRRIYVQRASTLMASTRRIYLQRATKHYEYCCCLEVYGQCMRSVVTLIYFFIFIKQWWLLPFSLRALKEKGNTPKYGLIFHSTFIGRAGTKNKGRISRYLANKCSIASRIDCFSGKRLSCSICRLKMHVVSKYRVICTDVVNNIIS